MKREIFIDEASLFMSIPMMTAMAGGSIAAMYFSMDEIGFALLFLTAAAVICRGYCALTLRSVEVEMEDDNKILFPGDHTRICIRIRNTGRLPAVNAMIRIPIDKYGPVVPVNSRDYRMLTDTEVSKARMYGEAVECALEKKIVFLKRKDELEWIVELKARKRGEGQIEQIHLYCGEPLGLTSSAKTICGQCRILVCTKVVPVKIEPFLHNVKFSNRGVKSLYDDVTLIRSNRQYQTFDVAKSINWKLLASQKKLMVNLYDPVRTKNVHLIFDGESYNSKDIRKEALEDTLRILFSTILRLHQRGMGCGLSLPQSETFHAVNLTCGQGDILPLIAEYLAKYRVKLLEPEEPVKPTILQQRSSFSTAVIKAREEKQKGIPKSKSVFKVADLLRRGGNIGEYFYFTYDGAKMSKNRLLSALVDEKVTVVSYRKCEESSVEKRRRIIHISAIGEEPKR